MKCLDAGSFAASNWGELAIGVGVSTTVTYFPAVLSGYVHATQSRSPSEGPAVAVTGRFGEIKITAPDNAITYVTTFAFSSSAYAGTPTPGDRIEADGISYRVTEVRRSLFTATLANFILVLDH